MNGKLQNFPNYFIWIYEMAVKVGLYLIMVLFFYNHLKLSNPLLIYLKKYFITIDYKQISTLI
jgi:hypothetical protein